MTHSHCPNCGKPIASPSLLGLCPDCLIKAGSPTAAGSESATPPSIEELSPHFSELEVLELLGRGGMGAVYKARQKQLDRIVALKILPPGIGDDPAFASRFAHEARALAKLNHPNIVTLYEFGEADGLFYFLMEYVDGLNLRELLHAGRIAPREALSIVPRICDALQFAHDRGIVHRDIKPENILLDRRGNLKVADFGLAKLMDPSDAASSLPKESEKIMGTPNYMAPEQSADPSGVDHRADIYALGVVFYQMLTGELPGERLEAPSHKVRLDVRLDEVVLRALEKEPARRYQQASFLKTEVEIIAANPSAEAKNVQTAGNASPMRGTLLLHAALFLLTALAFCFIAPAFTAMLRNVHDGTGERISGAATLLLSMEGARAALVFPLMLGVDLGLCVLSWHLGGRRALRWWSGIAITGLALIAALGAGVIMQELMSDYGKMRRELRAQQSMLSDPASKGASLGVLKVKLQQAKEEAAAKEVLYKNGVLSLEEMEVASEQVQELEAKLSGNASQAAQIRLATARRRLQMATEQSKAGIISNAEYEKAKGRVKIAEAELAELKTTSDLAPRQQ